MEPNEPRAAQRNLSSGATRRRGRKARLSPAVRFVLTVGAMSFFADFAYEGSRSVIGQYLGLLGAGALAISMITGFGELLGYGLRLFSGRGADRTGLYWPITIAGYLLQMSVIPLLALAGSWQIAALLIILERVGKAIRNPPRDAMLSHAAKEMGYGWGFGVHEALDQFGAMFGPLLVALIVATSHGDYMTAFAALAVPAAIVLLLLATARFLYPRPQDLEVRSEQFSTEHLPRVFWIYLAGAVLVAAGFADFPIIAYHFQRSGTVNADLTAMAVSGTGSLVFGRMFDRRGIAMLVPLTLLAAAYAPLAFLGGFWASLIGVCLWGLGMGVHESIIPAAVAPMVSPNRRASAYGLFTGAYGIAWFLGSTAIGALFSVSLDVLVAFAVAVELAAIPLILLVRRNTMSASDGAHQSRP